MPPIAAFVSGHGHETPFFAVILGLSATAAQAQVAYCLPRATMNQYLLERFSEVPILVGQLSRAHVWILYSRIDGATWTAVTVDKKAQACITNSGVHLMKPWERRS